MALNIKYRINFFDRDGASYRVNIYKDGTFPQIKELIGTNSPVIIEYENSEDKFNTVNGSGCSLKFYNDGTISSDDFFVIGMYDMKVEVQRWVEPFYEDPVWINVWSGWVNTESYDEDITWDEGEITLTANDGISAIRREKYFSGLDVGDDGLVIKPWTLSVVTIKSVILRCLFNCEFTRIYTAVDIRGEASQFDTLMVDLSNYVNEDNESLTKFEVLESVLKPLGLRIYIFGDACWIVDPVLFDDPSFELSYKAYSKVFGALASEDGVYNFSFDINDDTFRFVDGNQSSSMVGGFKRITSNYSAYPDTRKIIPFNPEDVVIDPLAPDVVVEYQSSDAYFTYKDDTIRTYEDYGIETWIEHGGLFTARKGSDESEFTNALGIISLVSDQSETDEAVKITGGYMPKNPDYIKVSFDIFVDTDSIEPSNLDTSRIEIPAIIQIGNKYGVWAYYNRYIAMSSDVKAPVTLSVEGSIFNASYIYRKWVTLSFIIVDMDNAGEFSISFNNNVKYFKYDSGNWVEQHTVESIEKYCFIKNFTITVNGTEISDEDVEYVTDSGVDFINSKTIEINNSSKRVNGCLDRGAFFNSNFEHETLFYRNSVPSVQGSIGTMLAQAYLGNYATPYRTISGTIQTNYDILRNASPIGDIAVKPYPIDNVLTPISILRYASAFPYKFFIFAGGSIDLVNKTINGTWHGIFNADYDITEI